MNQPNKKLDLTPDTEQQENMPPHPDDKQEIASGSQQAPGGSNASHQNDAEMTHGQQTYPGPRSEEARAEAGK